jgi:hypothetical protein
MTQQTWKQQSISRGREDKSTYYVLRLFLYKVIHMWEASINDYISRNNVPK